MTTNSSSLVSERYPAIWKSPRFVGNLAVATRSTVIGFDAHGQSFASSTVSTLSNIRISPIILPLRLNLTNSSELTNYRRSACQAGLVFRYRVGCYVKLLV